MFDIKEDVNDAVMKNVNQMILEVYDNWGNKCCTINLVTKVTILSYPIDLKSMAFQCSGG